MCYLFVLHLVPFGSFSPSTGVHKNGDVLRLRITMFLVSSWDKLCHKMQYISPHSSFSVNKVLGNVICIRPGRPHTPGEVRVCSCSANKIFVHSKKKRYLWTQERVVPTTSCTHKTQKIFVECWFWEPPFQNRVIEKDSPSGRICGSQSHRWLLPLRESFEFCNWIYDQRGTSDGPTKKI